MSIASIAESSGRFEQLRFGREVLRAEAEAITAIAAKLDQRFGHAVEIVFACRRSVIVIGMGKAGIIAQKIAATLASTGTPSHFLHPAEAAHGDLGRIHADDVVVILSASGETEEIIRLLPPIQSLGCPLIAVTANTASSLARAATECLEIGSGREACSLGLAPSTSTTCMLALGDALALVVSRMRGFAAEDFARFHPGGSLGRKLARVDDLMRPLEECRVARDEENVRAVFARARRPGRRTGAIMLVDSSHRLSGLFTDSDLAKLLELKRDSELDRPIAELMTRAPKTLAAGSRVREAVALMAECRISELPIVDSEGRPVGLVDITDVVAWLPTSGVSPVEALGNSGPARQQVPGNPSFGSSADDDADGDAESPGTLPFPHYLSRGRDDA